MCLVGQGKNNTICCVCIEFKGAFEWTKKMLHDSIYITVRIMGCRQQSNILDHFLT
jgi:hypothetical protein